MSAPAVLWNGSALDRLRGKFPDAKREGAEWVALCPAHDDRRPSFKFRQGENGVVVKCWSGCTQEALTAALEHRGIAKCDLFDGSAPQARREGAELAEKAKHRNARGEAARLMATSRPCSESQYLRSKGIGAHGVRQLSNGDLVLAFLDTEGTVHTTQTIRALPGGGWEKRFQEGGDTKGHFAVVDDVDLASATTLLECEGFATGCSIREATGDAVVCVGGKSNLLRVAVAIREKYPHLPIVLCADVDAQSEATAAARAVGGRVAVPKFTSAQPKGDFNDLHQAEGLGAVRACIAEAQSVDSDPRLQSPSDWSEPRPLPEGLPAVSAFSERLLPASLGPWVMDAADRMQCAPEFVAVAAIWALGVVIGRRCGIFPKMRDSWIVVANLWAAIVGRPGLAKSPAIEVGITPLRRLAVAERERHAAELKDHEWVSQVAEAEKTAARKRIATASSDQLIEIRQILEKQTVAPTERRYLVNDTTAEKLAMICADNPLGVGLLRDELTGLLATMERDGHENDRALFLEGWGGNQSYTTDRVGRGTQHIDKFCLSILGGIQPAPLAAYMKPMIRGGGAADGLFQRFQLAVYPDVTAWRHVDRWPDTAAKNAAYGVYERLNSLSADVLGVESDAHEGMPALRFSAPAQELFDEWLGDLERRLRLGREHEAFESHLAKYRKLMPAMALIGHLAESPGRAGPVSLVAAQRAAAWCDFLESHARRIYACVLNADDMAARMLLSKIADGSITQPVLARDVYRRHWSGLSTIEDVEGALAVLELHGYVRRDEVRTGGRPRTEFRVHPSIAGGRK